MKKIILLAVTAFFLQPVFSQSEKFIGAMKKKYGGHRQCPEPE